MNDRIEFYNKIIPIEIRTALLKTRREDDGRQWMIGFCARDSMMGLKIAQQHGTLLTVTQEQLFGAISHFAGGVGMRRVAKLRLVVERLAVYRSQYPFMPFGLFERAYDFGDEGENFLSFCSEYQEEHGEQTFSKLVMSFRAIMQGKDVVDQSLSTSNLTLPEPERYIEPGTESPADIPKRDALRIVIRMVESVKGTVRNLLEPHMSLFDKDAIFGAIEGLENEIEILSRKLDAQERDVVE